MNVFIIIFTMAVAATTGPNYQASALSAATSLGDGSGTAVDGVFPPVQHHANLPVTGNFIGSVNGIM